LHILLVVVLLQDLPVGGTSSKLHAPKTFKSRNWPQVSYLQHDNGGYTSVWVLTTP